MIMYLRRRRRKIGVFNYQKDGFIRRFLASLYHDRDVLNQRPSLISLSLGWALGSESLPHVVRILDGHSFRYYPRWNLLTFSDRMGTGAF